MSLMGCIEMTPCGSRIFANISVRFRRQLFLISLHKSFLGKITISWIYYKIKSKAHFTSFILWSVLYFLIHKTINVWLLFSSFCIFSIPQTADLNKFENMPFLKKWRQFKMRCCILHRKLLNLIWFRQESFTLCCKGLDEWRVNYQNTTQNEC